VAGRYGGFVGGTTQWNDLRGALRRKDGRRRNNLMSPGSMGARVAQATGQAGRAMTKESSVDLATTRRSMEAFDRGVERLRLAYEELT
jgi:hypothetical protein